MAAKQKKYCDFTDAEKDAAKQRCVNSRRKKPEYYAEKQRQRRANNPDADKNWRAGNRLSINARHRAWSANRRETDPSFRITRSLRERIRRTLMDGIAGGASKSAPTMKLLGCTMEQFMEHIEAQFDTKMTWSNYGEWHLDHISPCSSFNLTDPEQQRQCFNWWNIQPLWASDNFKKHAKIFISTPIPT